MVDLENKNNIKKEEMTLDRAIQIIQDAINWMFCDMSDLFNEYSTLNEYIHISDEELNQLGFGYLIPDNYKDT